MRFNSRAPIIAYVIFPSKRLNTVETETQPNKILVHFIHIFFITNWQIVERNCWIVIINIGLSLLLPLTGPDTALWNQIWRLRVLKELYHRRIFFRVCLKFDQYSYEWDFQRDQLTWNANDNGRLKQTMLYFRRAANFRDKHYPNRSVRDAFRICCFDITISWKRYVFYRKGT